MIISDAAYFCFINSYIYFVPVIDSRNLLFFFSCSIPFSTDDIYMALPAVEPSDVDLPKFLSEYPSAQFLVKDLK